MRKFGRVPAYRSGESLRREMEQTAVPSGMVVFWNIGQVGTVIKCPPNDDGHAAIVAIDPYLTRSIECEDPDTEFVREYDPPLEPEDLQICDAVFITHHHGDHMDVDTLLRLHKTNPNVRFMVPKPHVGTLVEAGLKVDSVLPAMADVKVELEGISVLPIAAAHTEYETDVDGNHVFLGYLFAITQTDSRDTLRIYHSGDTVITQKLLDDVKPLRPHIALLPINGGDYFRTDRNIIGNMSARSAVDFASTVGVDLLLPNHYDMFANNRDNPSHVVDYLFHEYPDLKFHMLALGERFLYFPSAD